MEKEELIHNSSDKISDTVKIDALIDALFDIRLSLSIKRISKPTISTEELKEIVDKAKNDKDISVKNAIDAVFDEYLGNVNQKQTDSLSLEDMEAIISSKVINFQDAKEPKDKQLNLVNNNFQGQSDKAA